MLGKVRGSLLPPFGDRAKNARRKNGVSVKELELVWLHSSSMVWFMFLDSNFNSKPKTPKPSL